MYCCQKVRFSKSKLKSRSVDFETRGYNSCSFLFGGSLKSFFVAGYFHLHCLGQRARDISLSPYLASICRSRFQKRTPCFKAFRRSRHIFHDDSCIFVLLFV